MKVIIHCARKYSGLCAVPSFVRRPCCRRGSACIHALRRMPVHRLSSASPVEALINFRTMPLPSALLSVPISNFTSIMFSINCITISVLNVGKGIQCFRNDQRPEGHLGVVPSRLICDVFPPHMCRVSAPYVSRFRLICVVFPSRCRTLIGAAAS